MPLGTLLLGSSMIGAGASMAGQQMNQQYNEKLLDKQFDFNREMYDKQMKDAYQWYKDIESPSALRAAWQQAGYSPTAMLGQSAPSAPQASVGGTDMPYQNGNPFQGLGDNLTRSLDIFRNSLNDSVQRENMIQDIASKKLENAKSQLELNYMEDNYILDKNADRVSKLRGFNLGEASSADNYIRNGADYTFVGKVYEEMQNEILSAQKEYQDAITSKTKSEKERIEIGKRLDELQEQYFPIMQRMQLSLMQSQIDDMDFMHGFKNQERFDKVNYNKVMFRMMNKKHNLQGVTDVFKILPLLLRAV